ncbi:hypothetical protein PPROV_000626200 [Pycnococcus provasolii]|uniref:Uncharacterized protein n=1 Tax=Pycnococcus provasolii TaxID=41880 RepID=A0A830HNZ7_9CHLO|nr:hypothetical protein PPROV_000626200 [Pycnococcus provasolii]
MPMMSCTSRPVSRAAVRTTVRTTVRLPRAAAAAGARKSLGRVAGSPALVSSSSRRNARVVITRASEEGGPNPVESALQSFIDAQPDEVADEDKGPIVYGLCFAAGAVIFILVSFLLRLPALLGIILGGGFAGYTCYVASGLLPSTDSGFVRTDSYARQDVSEDEREAPSKYKEDEPWSDKK